MTYTGILFFVFSVFCKHRLDVFIRPFYGINVITALKYIGNPHTSYQQPLRPYLNIMAPSLHLPILSIINYIDVVLLSSCYHGYWMTQTVERELIMFLRRLCSLHLCQSSWGSLVIVSSGNSWSSIKCWKYQAYRI